MTSINLPDEVSTFIDSMTKFSLIDLANQCTHLCVDTIRQKYDFNDFTHPLDSDPVWDELVEIDVYGNFYLLLTVRSAKTFAYELLAKAV